MPSGSAGEWVPIIASSKILKEYISVLEFKSTLKFLKGNTPGFDKIPYPMLKKLPYNLLSMAIQLYKIIFSSSIIPQSWKTSTIIPIQKLGKDITKIEAYRLISLIPCLSKILEKNYCYKDNIVCIKI